MFEDLDIKFVPFLSSTLELYKFVCFSLGYCVIWKLQLSTILNILFSVHSILNNLLSICNATNLELFRTKIIL